MDNHHTHELVLYSRTYGCPLTTLAKRVLADYTIPYREVFIDTDESAKARLNDWIGFLSVPTLIVARHGEDVPFAEPEPLDAEVSPRGIDRGTMITEPSSDQLTDWLGKHGFLTER